MKMRFTNGFSTNGRNPFVLSLSLVVVLFLFFTNCNKSDDGNDDPSPNNNVNQYIVSLPSWDNFCPTKADSDEAFDPSLEFDCTTKIFLYDADR